MQKDYSYIGKGSIYLGPYDESGARRPIGNASALTLTVSQEEKSLLDYTSAGGGKRNQIFRITGVTMSITVHDISPENLAVAAFGSVTAVSAGTVSAEAHTAYTDGLVRFDNTPDPAQSITVTGSGGTPTYVEGTDYELAKSGIVVLSGGSIADASDIEVGYTKLAGNVIEALTQTTQEYKLTFDGLNEANSGKPYVVDVHRAKFSPLQNFGLIADDFAGLEMSGEAVKDTTITTSGLSQFFKAEIAA